MEEKPGKITKGVLILIASIIIFLTIIISYAYIANISKIKATESNVEVIATLASIFVSITILIFVNIIRSEPWKKFRYNKFTSIIMVLLLMVAIFFLFGAGSTGIISSSLSMHDTILFIYSSISICAIILTILLPTYTYFS